MIPPRADQAWPPRPDVPDRVDLAGPIAPASRRRRAWVVIVAVVVTTTLLATSIVAITGNVRSGDPLVALGIVDPEGDHEFFRERFDGSPYRWDPCEPIHYVVNTLHMPLGGLADVHQAVEVTADATGIEFVYDGETARTASWTVNAGYEVDGEFAPVLISWLPPDEFEEWANPRRVAAIAQLWTGTDLPLWEYRSGQIVVNVGAGLPVGWAHRDALGPVVLHEWGHVVGLDHVADGDELMWSPEMPDAELPDVSVTGFGPGDLEGLSHLGAEAGCIEDE